MTQITIRGVEPELHKSMKEEAKRHGLSMNRYILSILKEAVGLATGKPDLDLEFHDLDDLAGTWTQEELEEFYAHLALQREVDEELWQ
ncbi:MAG: toxin-antitoxin system HicB family antitoxin [Anaerolineales bacterium]|nr:toxin-antitoxin system HicB family antitoxin [Anaerolineales bacterium]